MAHDKDPAPETNGPKSRGKLILRVVFNLLLMAVVALIIGWLTMTWLDTWTNHGETVSVPSLQGMSYDKAMSKLEEMGLTPVVTDSVYDDKTRPGTVLEQNPRPKTTVKPGREVYMTINAFSPKMVTLPMLTDISVRQARSILEGLGVTRITERPVPSDYPDLVLCVRYKGKSLYAGASIPINGDVTLDVGTPYEEDPELMELDSMPNPVDPVPDAANTSAEMLDLF